LVFAKHVGFVFLGAFALMLMVDIMELTRRGADLDVPIQVIVAISAMRLPSLAEQLVPFAVLIGALMTLVALSRRSELIIARASGLSAWQFLIPLIVVAALVGIAPRLALQPVFGQP
jgi:lipopolysaccharide export system permease protein